MVKSYFTVVHFSCNMVMKNSSTLKVEMVAGYHKLTLPLGAFTLLLTYNKKDKYLCTPFESRPLKRHKKR